MFFYFFTTPSHPSYSQTYRTVMIRFSARGAYLPLVPQGIVYFETGRLISTGRLFLRWETTDLSQKKTLILLLLKEAITETVTVTKIYCECSVKVKNSNEDHCSCKVALPFVFWVIKVIWTSVDTFPNITRGALSRTGALNNKNTFEEERFKSNHHGRRRSVNSTWTGPWLTMLIMQRLSSFLLLKKLHFGLIIMACCVLTKMAQQTNFDIIYRFSQAKKRSSRWIYRQ